MSGPRFETDVALRWLRALRSNNDRAWFHANREIWDDLRPQWEELVTYLLHAGTRYDERLAHVDPKRCLFRLANDTRFRNDKTPYKSHLAAWLSPGGKDGSFPGYYVHFSPGGSLTSCGVYVPTKPHLHALRTVFADDGGAARAFDRIARAAPLRGYEWEFEPLRVTPRGFPREHPRRELIRARMYLVRRDVADAELRERGPAAVYLEAIKRAAPLVRWLDGVAPRARARPDEDDWID